ncbi:hypothetical protein HH214_17530 [Mucilaginibacter robiniae]|uniref:Streptomycin biosynthesis protein StrF domain-containing protein n=1 Tax=Mucilaginibacter robiniae TaxID=2728022 RepID=A0A7L5E340_9SPHI|nr:glycosyltransferase [Mucilaginibacter robiniae]QJD97545.1 hypothetical protein HH214_17530 [Mucilaginibacter robiniae]
MISIVISSYKEACFKQVEQNILETIGVPHEIIKIDNPGIYGITEAYNIGGARAKHDILCFVHDDVKFLTTNWGQNILNHFNEVPDLGLIGIAGATSKTPLPTGWYHPNLDHIRVNMIQHKRNGEKIHDTRQINAQIDFVKTLDGVFLVTKKDIWKKFKFSSELKGFHVYDIDFCLRVGQKYKVGVVYDVLMEHFSEGTFTDEWVTTTINYHNNPHHQGFFDKKSEDPSPYRVCWYYFLMLDNKISFKNRLKYCNELGVDVKSIPFALNFLFPTLVKPIFDILLKTKQQFR